MLGSSHLKPEPTEYAEYFKQYVSLVGDGVITEILGTQIKETAAVLRRIPYEMTAFRYEEGKWSVAELLGHLIDTERVMVFRALSFARGDKTEIPGMDQDQYVDYAMHDRCEFADLIREFEESRRGNVLFFKHLPAECWDNSGIASGHSVSVRALAYIIAGHERHHMAILAERYLPRLKQ